MAKYVPPPTVKVDPVLPEDDYYLSEADDATEAEFLNWARNTYGFATSDNDVKKGYKQFDDESYDKVRRQFAWMKTNKKSDINFGDQSYDPWAYDADTNQVRHDFITQNKRAPTDVEIASQLAAYKDFLQYGDVDRTTERDKVAQLLGQTADGDGNPVTDASKYAALQDEQDYFNRILALHPEDGQAKHDLSVVQKMLKNFQGNNISSNTGNDMVVDPEVRRKVEGPVYGPQQQPFWDWLSRLFEKGGIQPIY